MADGVRGERVRDGGHGAAHGSPLRIADAEPALTIRSLPPPARSNRSLSIRSLNRLGVFATALIDRHLVAVVHECVVGAAVPAHASRGTSIAVVVVDWRAHPPFAEDVVAVVGPIQILDGRLVHNEKRLARPNFAFGVEVDVRASCRAAVVEAVLPADEGIQRFLCTNSRNSP